MIMITSSSFCGAAFSSAISRYLNAKSGYDWSVNGGWNLVSTFTRSFKTLLREEQSSSKNNYLWIMTSASNADFSAISKQRMI